MQFCLYVTLTCELWYNWKNSIVLIANMSDHFFEITTNVVSIALILSNYASWAVNEFFSSKSKAHCCVVIKALALEDNDVWLLFLDYKIALRLIIVPRRFYSSLKGDCCIHLFEEFLSKNFPFDLHSYGVKQSQKWPKKTVWCHLDVRIRS